jgi:hypothetical protein
VWRNFSKRVRSFLLCEGAGASGSFAGGVSTGGVSFLSGSIFLSSLLALGAFLSS